MKRQIVLAAFVSLVYAAIALAQYIPWRTDAILVTVPDNCACGLTLSGGGVGFKYASLKSDNPYGDPGAQVSVMENGQIVFAVRDPNTGHSTIVATIDRDGFHGKVTPR